MALLTLKLQKQNKTCMIFFFVLLWIKTMGQNKEKGCGNFSILTQTIFGDQQGPGLKMDATERPLGVREEKFQLVCTDYDSGDRWQPLSACDVQVSEE